MSGAFTPNQLAALKAMEQACSECDTWIAALEALGINMDERKMQNDLRRATCARCREVDEAARQGKLQ